jgi:hypothetical protein
LTSTPFISQRSASQVRPDVMWLGLDSAGGGSKDNKTRELMGKGRGKDKSKSSFQECGLPRVMRLGLDTVYPKKEPGEEQGGGDDEPPRKRSKYHGVSQTTSLSTTLSEIPYQVFQSEDTDADEDSREIRLLLTLSPIDHLDHLLREDQGREESESVDEYNDCNPTPYFFQPDRWSCGYRNLQMLLGSLRVLRIREVKRETSIPGRSSTGGGMRQTRSLPLDISDRMMALAGVGEGFPQSSSESSPQETADNMGSSSSSTRMSREPNNQSQYDEDSVVHSANVAQSATLRAGYGRRPSLARGLLPSVLETQILVEQAWQAGFDPEGLDIFRPEGVRNNKRPIGEAFYV